MILIKGVAAEELLHYNGGIDSASLYELGNNLPTTVGAIVARDLQGSHESSCGLPNQIVCYEKQKILLKMYTYLSDKTPTLQPSAPILLNNDGCVVFYSSKLLRT